MSELSRREVLELLAAGAAAAAAGCTAPPRHEREERDPMTDQAAATEAPSSASPLAEAADAIRGIVPLAGMPWPTLDPFLFCVHHDDAYPAGNERMGPAASLAGRNLGSDFEGIDGWRMYHGDRVPGFPSHPHRGFETVTVVRRGLLDHSDSMGAAARYGSGDVQWLTAGRGIQHAEMFPLLERSSGNPVELFQIWLNLPRARKMADPHFSMLWSGSIPRQIVRDAGGLPTEVTIVAGRFGELTPPSPPPSSYASQAGSDVAIWTIKMAAGARWTLPAAGRGINRSLYVFTGAGVRVGGRAVPSGRVAELRAHADVAIENAGEETEMLLLQGRPIGEPVVQHGPFVMNTREEIVQAFTDYRSTRFGGWPWDSDEPVHGREERFARHADGRVERPA